MTRAGLVVLIGTLLISGLRPSLAATEIQGQRDEMQLMAQNASTTEILDALSAKFNLTYRLPPSAGRTATGRYVGSLREVLARILDGNDYIVTVVDGGVDVVVLDVSGAAAIATSGGTGIVIPTAPVMPSNELSGRIPTATSVPNPPVVPAGSSPPPLATYVPR